MFNTSNILGILIFVGTVIMVFVDMYYSTLPNYTFELKITYVFFGLICGISLILLPEEFIKQQLKTLIRKWLKK